MAYWKAGMRITADRFAKYLQEGEESVSFSSASSHTQAVVFEFEFDSVPRVNANIESGAGASARWVARAINPSTTGFTLFVFSADATSDSWTDIPVSWTAVSP